MKKREYTCICFAANKGGALKYRRVTNVYNLFKNMLSAGYQLTAINVYDKQTKQFLKQLRTLHDAYQFFINN
ncbi:hypothetical protein D0T49_03075 [Paludibacter sp. 221]|nr:hypothetical protein [Paludibacter sp. 221]